MTACVFAVVGGRRSGKTTTIEILTKELVNRGYKIAAVKHISEPDFTIDREGKDTWRYAQAGADTIISVAAGEISTIEKVHGKKLRMKDLLKKCKGNDIVFIEGFKKLISKKRSIHKIVVVKSAEEAAEAIRTFCPILVFTGPFSTQGMDVKIPHVDIMTNPAKIADLVEKVVKKEYAT